MAGRMGPCASRARQGLPSARRAVRARVGSAAELSVGDLDDLGMSHQLTPRVHDADVVAPARERFGHARLEPSFQS